MRNNHMTNTTKILTWCWNSDLCNWHVPRKVCFSHNSLQLTNKKGKRNTQTFTVWKDTSFILMGIFYDMQTIRNQNNMYWKEKLAMLRCLIPDSAEYYSVTNCNCEDSMCPSWRVISTMATIVSKLIKHFI